MLELHIDNNSLLWMFVKNLFIGQIHNIAYWNTAAYWDSNPYWINHVFTVYVFESIKYIKFLFLTFQLLLISVLLFYRGGLSQPLEDTETKEVNTEVGEANQWEAEDHLEDIDAVQSEDEGRASLTYQTGGKEHIC